MDFKLVVSTSIFHSLSRAEATRAMLTQIDLIGKNGPVSNKKTVCSNSVTRYKDCVDR